MKDNISRISLISVGILSSLILIFAFINYLLPVLLPFLIAGLIASLTVNPARSLSKRIHAPEKIIRLILSVLLTILFFSTVAILFWRLSTTLWQILSNIGQGSRLYAIFIAMLDSDIPILGELLPPELAEKIGYAVGELVSNCLTLIAGWITSFATALPQLFFFIMVTLISLIYFALDYDRISSFIIALLPTKVTKKIVCVRNSVIAIMKKYLSSYLLIMLITYSVILVGLWLLSVEHAPMLALIIALLDILPVIGVGTVLVPWSILELAGGNRVVGIGLLILFVANTVIRQLTEPKIVGKSLDLHPLVTLMMIYIGYALFGFAGIFILPTIVVILMSALKQNNSTEVV